MRLLETMIELPLAGALGWTLLHSLWQGVIVSAGLAAVLIAVRSARVRYAAACAALLAMFGTFCFTLIYLLPKAGQVRQTIQMSPNPPWNLGSASDFSSGSPSVLATIAPWLALCWIVGVAIFCLAQVAGWHSVRRLRRRGVCAPPQIWQSITAKLSARLCISRRVELLESCLANVPIVLGHFRPVILIPVGMLAGLPASQVEAILLHELAHIRRSDYLVNLFQRSVEGLLFYHPAAWWVSRVIRTERENCCDDVAVAMSGNAQEYALALTTLEQTRWSGPEAALAANGGNLVNRIRRILHADAPTGAQMPFTATLLLVATAGLALAAWGAEAPHRASAPPKSQVLTTEAKISSDWINEDVVYIIGAPERSAFERLSTNAEREKFIEQFWLRRDPTPGTPQNEFKEEHYRRIAYANERYPSSKPGWKTDRGRIYIQSGPPDEIESHPSGDAGDPPYEAWLYRAFGGTAQNMTFKFIDVTLTGEFELRSTKQTDAEKPKH